MTTHRVIAPDLPGLGASEVSEGPPDADAVLTWLGELIEQTCAIPPVLVGKGPGGALAARFAIDDSDRIDRRCWWTRTGWIGSASARDGALLHRRAVATDRARARRGFRRYCFVDLDGCAPRWVSATNGWRRTPWTAFAPECQGAMRSLMRQLASAIPPGYLTGSPFRRLCIWGRHDLGCGGTSPRLPAPATALVAARGSRHAPATTRHRAAASVPRNAAYSAREESHDHRHSRR